MTSPYGNKVIETAVMNTDAISMAANRLMPPQYDEFIKALRCGDCSDATRKYWVEFYDFILECAEDNSVRAQASFGDTEKAHESHE